MASPRAVSLARGAATCPHAGEAASHTKSGEAAYGTVAARALAMLSPASSAIATAHSMVP